MYIEKSGDLIYFFFIKDHISSALGINPPPPDPGAVNFRIKDDDFADITTMI